jgi:hypothetical protein
LGNNESTLSNKVNVLGTNVAILRHNFPASPQQLNSIFWTNLSINISDLATQNTLIIDSKDITNCDIWGAGNINFEYCDFTGECDTSNTSQAFATIPSIPNQVTVEFRNCEFDSCNFWNVTIIGTSDEIKQDKTVITVK